MEETDLISPQYHFICIVGPTAVGKTALAVRMAQRFGGEIINADSRQVYRGMTVGTAKPSAEGLAAAPHHLIDILDPHENFGLSLFLEHATEAIRDIRDRALLPIVCGGTGQYVWGLLEGQRVPAAPPDELFRSALEAEAEEIGAVALHQRLAAIDPVRAGALDARNVRRVIRALEIHHVTGRLPSEYLSDKQAPDGKALVLGLTMPRDTLYRRIDDRVDQMMRDGFLAEVEGLLESGYANGAGPLASPGYRELGQYLAGETSLEEAVARTKTQTHRLARRQYTWFKPTDPRIDWLDVTDPAFIGDASDRIAAYVGRVF